MKRIVLAILMLILFISVSLAQEPKLVSSATQFRSLIDMPTAGVLQRGEYDFDMRIFPQGGVLMGFSVGLFDRFNMGVSFGGTDIISSEPKIEWNPQPAVDVKYRLFEESHFFPAIALGYSSQGYGAYIDSLDRYALKSRGMYGVLSKNFQYLPQRDLGVHGGLNFNTSERDDDQGLNFFLGADVAINEELSVITEYDLALDDDAEEAFGEGNGYINAGLRWTFADHLMFQFNFKDIFSNNKYTDTTVREIKIVYIQRI
jgi:hypothetical protein